MFVDSVSAFLHHKESGVYSLIIAIQLFSRPLSDYIGSFCCPLFLKVERKKGLKIPKE